MVGLLPRRRGHRHPRRHGGRPHGMGGPRGAGREGGGCGAGPGGGAAPGGKRSGGARRGAHLTLAARNTTELSRVAEACRGAGGRAIAVATDVTHPEACRTMVEAAVREFGGVDCLVNNAGISMWARFDEVTDLGMFE